MAPRYRKLIRDRIPEIASREGRSLNVEPAPGESAFDLLLARKLVEESAEIHDALIARDRQALVSELADLQTLIDTIAERAGIGFDEITDAVASKINQRGAFHERLVLRDRKSTRLNSSH